MNRHFVPTETDVDQGQKSSVNQYSFKDLRAARKDAKARKAFLEMALNALESAELRNYTSFMVTFFASYESDMNEAIKIINRMLVATVGEINALTKLAEMRKGCETK